MMNTIYCTRTFLHGVLTALACAMSMLKWDAVLAQTDQCTGVDLTCLEEDRDTHDGYCFNVSYKKITLSGRDPDNMLTGWYLYSHRGGGLWPIDPTRVPVWGNVIEDLELMRGLEPPEDEVSTCLSGNFRVCVTQLEDDHACVEALRIVALPDECELILRKLSLPDGSPSQWYGALPDSAAFVPLETPRPSTEERLPFFAYDRYGGSEQLLSWLELAENLGLDRVNVCELRDAHQCYTDGEYSGDVRTCADIFIGDN